MNSYTCCGECVPLSSANGQTPITECSACGHLTPMAKFCRNCGAPFECPEEVALCKHLRKKMGSGTLKTGG